MTSSKGISTIQRFTEQINSGNLDIIDEMVERDFFNYVPKEGELTAPQVLKSVLADIIKAIPDFKIETADFTEEGRHLVFNMTLSGTHRNNLWGAPGSGKTGLWTSSVTSRFTNGKFTFQWNEISVPELLGTLRQIDLVPPPEDMDKPLKNPVVLPEFLLKLVFTGQAGDKKCSHLDQIRFTEPDTDVCQFCVESGDVWPALRMCLICGYVGCCDTSKNKHAKAHYEETGHALIRSIRLSERWVWCYEDSAFFLGEILDKYR